MARRVVVSEPTDETFIFDDDWNDAEGRVHRLDFSIGTTGRVPLHAHPGTSETFEVVSGVLSLRIGGRALKLGPGERVATAPGEAHSLWNEGPERTSVMTWYDPPLAIEPFFTAIPAAIASKSPFRLAVLWADHRAVSQPKSLAVGLFVTVFGALGRLIHAR